MLLKACMQQNSAMFTWYILRLFTHFVFLYFLDVLQHLVGKRNSRLGFVKVSKFRYLIAKLMFLFHFRGIFHSLQRDINLPIHSTPPPF